MPLSIRSKKELLLLRGGKPGPISMPRLSNSLFRLAPIERVGYLNGNTLLAFGYKNKVVEYDISGKEVWQYKIRGAWSAEKMKNGNVLLTAYNLDKVVEVDPGGKTVWEYALEGCLKRQKIKERQSAAGFFPRIARLWKSIRSINL